jgi:hypothetical protein
MSYPPATYHGSGEALQPMSAEERAAFMQRHDTHWL